MKQILDEHSIVLRGHWNSRIFTPNWVIGRLTKVREIPIEFLLNPAVALMRFTFDGITMSVGNELLELKPISLEERNLRQAQEVARSVLRELKHTPIAAVGVNFGYEIRPEEGSLLKVFNLNDSAGISDFGDAQIMETTITRSIKVNERILNLIISADETSAVVKFNYHTPIMGNETGTEQALSCLEGDVIEFQKQSLEFLNQVYGSKLEIEG